MMYFDLATDSLTPERGNQLGEEPMTRHDRSNEVDPAEQLRTWLAIYGDNQAPQPSERATDSGGNDQKDALRPPER
jgi:hypothetical protein